MQVVERRVEVPVPITVSPARRDWPGLLAELAHQIDDGRIYDRDLLNLSDALSTVLAAYERRSHVRSGAVERESLERSRRQALTPFHRR
ncbi:hypothetical protein [Geodermatophilus nigrescens]|uniref:Uncharacterized protein n=1 Tax=Geodermatophilus nigrescens TaxID=1070870 RepID=A0A1M5FZ04_9ACTN|nr:hypothetical protein [Geodermatophilus nigrescens]SHF96421.1 hypothetical protein SAMN05444351_1457 [Geodermatophilus nigrescens]